MDDAHILVVDDDRRLRELLRKYLSDNGYLVTTAADAAEAEVDGTVVVTGHGAAGAAVARAGARPAAAAGDRAAGRTRGNRRSG